MTKLNRPCCFGCFKGISKSFQVLLSGIETVMVLTLTILKWRVLQNPQISSEFQEAKGPHKLIKG